MVGNVGFTCLGCDYNVELVSSLYQPESLMTRSVDSHSMSPDSMAAFMNSENLMTQSLDPTFLGREVNGNGAWAKPSNFSHRNLANGDDLILHELESGRYQ